ncbi:pilus assembly protein TadG-related protein [Streptomyces sp. NBC_00876]|uniref:pilus assembly protein TadG-related protein n=1 Tax=Streptomyces sp. NBC_00876 TaxID=2975853 RepID=UPI00386C6338|nr:pilus assembly protein TadG-related protein [Streptomyces sp. NBC_00876]
MIRRANSETGQAAPLYITAMTGLLFLALVFFAFGEADVQRNGAQTAADASALAAAKDSRSKMALELKAHITDRGYYIAVFNLPFFGSRNTCPQASAWASKNDATNAHCIWPYQGRWAFFVDLQSEKGMSTKLVPRTKGKKAKTEAVAVVENLCKFIPNPDMTSSSIGEVVCKSGLVWVVSPHNVAVMPKMADLFSVRLEA